MLMMIGKPNSVCKEFLTILDVGLPNIETWNQRLIAERESQGYKQADIKRAVKVSAATVSDWESGNQKPKGENLIKLCRFLNVSSSWLMENRKPKRPPSAGPFETREPQEDYNTSQGPDIKGRVPLISSTTAGNWGEVVDNFSPGDAEDWIPHTQNVGPHAFALRIEGDSMLPTIPDGAMVIVDPDTAPKHRSVIIVRQNGHTEATCKRLMIDGPSRYLQPDNDRYPVMQMSDDAVIAGVVRQVLIDL